MILSRFRQAASAAALIAASCTACAQQADFNEVGSAMAKMLQNNHFEQIPFDAKLSQRFLDDYIKDLDSTRLYFTKADIDGFNAKYGNQLHTLLLQGNSVEAATEIYRVFEKRVEARVALTEKILKEEQFDFTKDESVPRSRKDAPWAKDENEAVAIWRLQIKEAVLAEVLRREFLTKLATEQGKPDPAKGDRDPKEKISLRYKRFLNSVKDVDDEDIANYFFSAVARAYDPHTDYMSPREMSKFKDDMKNELVGIGALLQPEEDGATKIMGIVVGGPADLEGTLKLNDRVVAVNSLNTGNPEDATDIMFMKLDKVVDLIRGKEGTSVALKIEPAGAPPGETKVVVIQRGKVALKADQASGDIIEMKDSKGIGRRMGVITLPSFYSDFDEGTVSCSVDVERILNRLVEEKIDGLVLDLRNNGGGSLEEVRRMTGFFINRGPVVQIKGNVGPAKVRETDSGPPIYDGPMVVLTDKSSASASEILAGALQDYNRAVIVGESSTFGKGTVQQPMDISNMLPGLFIMKGGRAGYLKATIQKFYRPSGSSTQLDGVVPQLILPSLIDALEVGEAYLDNALPHDRIRPAAAFKPADPQFLFVPALKELSQARIKDNKDFGYIIEDVIKAKERIKQNSILLNKSSREKELADEQKLQDARNAERRSRFAKMAEEDKKSMKFLKVSLDDVTKPELREYDPSGEDGAYMRRAKDEDADLDKTPKWPSGIDPMKRESINVLKDLVEFTANAKIAGLLPKKAQ
jgi:carboxyl-terminal processing protease